MESAFVSRRFDNDYVNASNSFIAAEPSIGFYRKKSTDGVTRVNKKFQDQQSYK
jgi:hypothetical protein